MVPTFPRAAPSWDPHVALHQRLINPSVLTLIPSLKRATRCDRFPGQVGERAARSLSPPAH